MIEWLAWLRDAAGPEPTALVSILASEGSAPRGAGTRMLVTADAQRGTIGGGNLEYRVIEQARAILDLPPGHWRVQDYPLGPMLGQCCGGRVRLLVEHVDPESLGWLADAAEERVLVSTLMPDRVARYISTEAVPASLSARGARPREGESFAEVVGQHRRPLYLFGAGHVGRRSRAMASICRSGWRGSTRGPCSRPSTASPSCRRIRSSYASPRRPTMPPSSS